MFIEHFTDEPVVITGSSHPVALQSLQGVPFGIKNNIAKAGFMMRAGSPALPESPAQETAEVVKRLEHAGAVCIGSLNMHELALGTTSANAFFGTVTNPRDSSRSAGGSSGGSAAAVADGSVPFTLGTDTGGSCRIPAAYCGVMGFRPTTDRYPSSGVFMISPTRDTVGVFAHFASDIALVDAAITGETLLPEIQIANLKIGLPRQGFFTESSPEVATVVEYAIEKLEQAGIEFVDVEIPGAGDIALAGLYVVGYEAPREVLKLYGYSPQTTAFTPDEIRLLRMFTEEIASEDVQSIFSHFVESPISEESYREALKQREQLQKAYSQVFSQHELNALIYPTVGIVAPPADVKMVTVNGIERPHFPYSIANTDPGSLAGLPSVSIPIPRLSGALPVGLGVEAPAGHDRELLAISTVIQKVLTSS